MTSDTIQLVFMTSEAHLERYGEEFIFVANYSFGIGISFQ